MKNCVLKVTGQKDFFLSQRDIEISDVLAKIKAHVKKDNPFLVLPLNHALKLLGIEGDWTDVSTVTKSTTDTLVSRRQV